MPGAPVGSMGGSLFQRLQANGNGSRPAEPGLPQREPAPPTVAFDAIDLSTLRNNGDSPKSAEVEAPEAEVPEAEAPEVDSAEVDTPEAEAPEAEITGTTEAEAGDARVQFGRPTGEIGHAVAEQDGSELEEVVAEESALDLPAAVTTYDLLDSRSPMPDPTEDETPIFRALRSNWLTSGAADDAWTTSEIEAGWEAAEQVAEAPTLQLSESGLPIRRPGKRLVPGGVSPAPTTVDRDPEAIRARLAAHAAGVSRGRTAAVDESVPVPSTSTEEGQA
jgi:hypothetical protein